MRSTPEWIGKTDDERVPDRVRLRVFDRHNGVCYLSGRKIRAGEKWELEHMKALCNGGEHRESNLAPALVAPHKVKTKADRREQAKTNAKRKSNLGIKRAKGRPMPGTKASGWKHKMNGEWVRRSRQSYADYCDDGNDPSN